MDTTPSGLAVVDSPLPYTVNGVFVDERYLTEEIDQLWVARQTYNGAIQSQKSEVRSLDTRLAKMLYTMKAVLSRPGRSGGWSEFLRDRKIPRASADRLVAGYQSTLGDENCLAEAIHGPTEEDAQKLFSAVWPRLHKKLTTSESVYWFICNLALVAGARHELRNGGIFVFDSPSETPEESSSAAAAPVPAEAATAVADPDGEVL